MLRRRLFRRVWGCTGTPRRLGRGAALVLCLALLVPATSAAASYYYSGQSALNPHGYWQTADNRQPRSYNRACREHNSGQVSVSYIADYEIQFSGVVWTNCPQAAFARLNNAYEPAHARCTHEGTVQFEMVCETTRP